MHIFSTNKTGLYSVDFWYICTGGCGNLDNKTQMDSKQTSNHVIHTVGLKRAI